MKIEITEADAFEILRCIKIAENEGFGSEDDSPQKKLYLAFPNLAPKPSIPLPTLSPKERREAAYKRSGIVPRNA